MKEERSYEELVVERARGGEKKLGAGSWATTLGLCPGPPLMFAASLLPRSIDTSYFYG